MYKLAAILVNSNATLGLLMHVSFNKVQSDDKKVSIDRNEASIYESIDAHMSQSTSE